MPAVNNRAPVLLIFIKLVVKKEITFSGSFAFDLISSTRLIFLIKHEHACKTKPTKALCMRVKFRMISKTHN